MGWTQFMSALNQYLFQLAMSDEARPLMAAVQKHIAVELGKSPLASESLNCSAPDTGNMEARVYVSAVKAMVPEKVCLIIDQAIQMHGAAGISQWTPLADMYSGMRHLRFADGPDEVHHMVLGRAEVQKHGLW
ncbi:MAG: hypothetical protein AMXMBFR74_08150 [Parvibaculum sp.]